MCAQQRLWSAWASAQTDQSSRCTQWVDKDPSFPHAQADPSLCRAHRALLVLSCCSSYLTQLMDRGTHHKGRQRWLRRACTSLQSRQNHHCSLTQLTGTRGSFRRIQPHLWHCSVIVHVSHDTTKRVFGSFRPGQTQNGLCSRRSYLQSWNFGCRI